MPKKIILLGGNSKKNIKWLQNMTNTLENSYSNVIPMKYSHWDLPEWEGINIEKEIDKLKILVKNTDDYIVVAKSVGILVTLLAIEQGVIYPKMIIAMGVPILFLENYNYDIQKLFTNASKDRKILIIQQTNDVIGNAELVREIVPSNIPLLKIAGSNHQYNCFKLLSKHINQFIKSNNFLNK